MCKIICISINDNGYNIVDITFANNKMYTL